jgi:CAAX protease family protein
VLGAGSGSSSSSRSSTPCSARNSSFAGSCCRAWNGAFGRGDWVANGVLFAAYHLLTPWVVLSPLADAFVLAYPTKRYRSAWIGIAVHSAQSVVIVVPVHSGLT